LLLLLMVVVGPDGLAFGIECFVEAVIEVILRIGYTIKHCSQGNSRLESK
jgi:hypothetical protein